MATALEAGVDAATLREALAALDTKRRSLQAHQARLEHQQEAVAAEVDRTRRLQILARTATSRLGAMAPPERRQVLDLLGVRVTVTGWSPCAACDGKGKVKGGRGGVRCEVCVGLRRVPTLRVEGTVFDGDVRELTGEGGGAGHAPDPPPRENAR